MLKKLDRYIISKFIGTFFFSILLIISIAVIFDITERMDDFIEKDAPISEIIFDYYLNFIPYFANLFSSLFTFIAVIFFTSKMASNTEIIAIFSSGVSFNRFLLPYYYSAMIIAIFSFALNSYVIPSSNKVRFDFTEKYIKNPYRNYDRNIHLQVSPNVFVYMQSYNVSNQVGYKFTIEEFKGGEVKSKLTGDYIKWNEDTKRWKIQNYYIRNVDGMDEEIIRGKQIDTLLAIKPADFSTRNTIVETMTRPQLLSFIEDKQNRGVENIEEYLIEKYRRIAFPFSTFILTLIGVSLSSRKVKGGIGLHIGLGLLLSFGYILFMQISAQFAIKGSLDPLIAVWLPNIIFSIIAGGLYLRAKR